MEGELYLYIRYYQKFSTIYKANLHSDIIYKCNQQQWLIALESVVLQTQPPDEFAFRIDFGPFRTFTQEIVEEGKIGLGLDKITDFISNGIENDPVFYLDNIIKFLGNRSVGATPLFFYGDVPQRDVLRKKISAILGILKNKKSGRLVEEIRSDLDLFGFAHGWGDTVGRVYESLNILNRILTHPDKEAITAFFMRLPLVHTAVFVTVHGFFAQERVLGKPDTGGQIVYILNQVRAFEKYLTDLWQLAGIRTAAPKIIILTRLIPNSKGTTCSHERELVHGTKNCWIIRIPFRDSKDNVLRDWVSRFKVWPYLYKYIREASKTILAECEGKPDLMIGNYTDGGLVATAMGREWNVPTGIIAHALEKSKYQLSDLNWRELETDYHFSAHFLSDVLSINSADYIITSSLQEIAGTPENMGQYESYESFALPGLYRIYDGINIHSTRFVINPPGVNNDTCFPYFEKQKRLQSVIDEVKASLFSEDPNRKPIGRLYNPEKPPIFTMARMDKIKNISGLVKCFVKSKNLREKCNLIVVAGYTDPAMSRDIEEKAQIRETMDLIEKYKAFDCIRWLPGDGDSRRVPEYYRIIADLKGVFVQPALYEAFGLTVIEAMASGLPVIATQFGGPSEIIEHGKSGFLFNPKNYKDIESLILKVVQEKDEKDRPVWDILSQGGVKRVQNKYNWDRYSERMNMAASIYGFWNNMTPRIRKLRQNYIDSL
ncbi:MAG: glycosyltransferase, partial [bacterium]